MSKKILFIGYDEDSGYHNPRDWDNLGELTTFSSRDFKEYNEGGNSWDNVEEALMRDFGLQAYHYKGQGGGLVMLLDRDPRDGTLSIHGEIVYTEAMIAVREELEEELGVYNPDEIAERLDLDFSGIDGLLIVPFAKIMSEYGSLDEDAIAQATAFLKGEIETYNMWARGDVYYGVLVDAATGRELDSCGGFIGRNPEQSGMFDHFEFEYDEVANGGRPYYDRREMQQAIDALSGDEGYDFDDEDTTADNEEYEAARRSHAGDDDNADDDYKDEYKGGGRTPNPSVPLANVGTYIWNRLPFTGNSISGFANDHGTGRLHAHAAEDFDTAVREARSKGPLRDTFYAVYSYNTPIAWWVKGRGAGGEWAIVAKTALAGSVTTSKHLSVVRKEMPSARVVNPALRGAELRERKAELRAEKRYEREAEKAAIRADKAALRATTPRRPRR